MAGRLFIVAEGRLSRRVRSVGRTKNEVDGHLRLQGLEIPGEPQAPGFPESLSSGFVPSLPFGSPRGSSQLPQTNPSPGADPGRGVPGIGGVGDPFPR